MENLLRTLPSHVQRQPCCRSPRHGMEDGGVRIPARLLLPSPEDLERSPLSHSVLEQVTQPYPEGPQL